MTLGWAGRLAAVAACLAVASGELTADTQFAAGAAAPGIQPQAPAWQQPPPGGGGRRAGRGPLGEDLTVRELERYFDSYEIVEARRALGLDEAAFQPVIERLRRLQNVRRRHQNERRQLMTSLRLAVEGGGAPDDTAIAAAVEALDAALVRHAQERRRALAALDAILTPPQRARFRLFQERFERQKLDLLSRARLGRRGGGPPGGGSPR